MTFGGFGFAGSASASNSTVAEPRFSGGSSSDSTLYAPAATTSSTTTAPMIRRVRLTGAQDGRRGRWRSAAAAEQPPDPRRYARNLDVERALVELSRPLRRPDADHRALAEPVADERRLAGIATGCGQQARALGQARRAVDRRELAEQAVDAGEQSEAVALDRQRRRWVDALGAGPLAEEVVGARRAGEAQRRPEQRHRAAQRLAAEHRDRLAALDLLEQAVAQPPRQPDRAAADRDPGRVAERRALAARERQVGGEVVGAVGTVEEAQQRCALSVQSRRQQ